jgi:hypothetical protein
MKHETSPEVVPHGSPQDDTFAGRGNRRSPARCQAIRSQQAERENQDLWCGSVLNANSTLTTLGYNAANEWMTATSGGKTATYSYDANGNVVATCNYCPTGSASEPPAGQATDGNNYRQGGLFYEPATKTYLLGAQ